MPVTSLAMKVYDLQWFTTFGLDYAEAAAALRADGIDTVLTQNRYDPLPGSGVDQASYLAEAGARLATYDDSTWVAALRSTGLRVYQTTATFFDPEALEHFPDARPIAADGRPAQLIDWYVGICPTHDDYLAAKIAKLVRVVSELQPDGLFLQFTRYPGFWENWTWAPDYNFTDADRFCFCRRCRSMFAADQEVRLPAGDITTHARWILESHGQAWTRWRCEQIRLAIQKIAAAVTAAKPDIQLMLNTLPFPATDFSGADVRREIAAQDLRLLADQVDRFELMTYLQILHRPLTWLAAAVTDARRYLPAQRELLCTLQLAPLYTDGIHATRHRARTITADDLEAAALTALGAGADGLVFYHWTDLLQDAAAGGRKRDVLRSVAQRSQEHLL